MSLLYWMKSYFMYLIYVFSFISCGSHSVILWKDKGHIMSWIYASCLCVDPTAVGNTLWGGWYIHSDGVRLGSRILCTELNRMLPCVQKLPYGSILLGSMHRTRWTQATPIWTMHIWDAWYNYCRWCIYEMHEDFPFYLFIVFLITIFPFTGSFISLICHGCCCWCHVCVFKLFLI